jgi:hypothetical protein
MPLTGCSLEDGRAVFDMDRHEVERVPDRRVGQVAGKDGREYFQPRTAVKLIRSRISGGLGEACAHRILIRLPLCR